MKINLFLLTFLLLGSCLYAQKEVQFNNGCNFASDKTKGTYTLFDPTAEAGKIVDEILNLAGIKERPFTLQVANVDNAQANQKGSIRYVLYSKKFMDNFQADAKTKWAAYFVFAHEIGHHVLGHNFAETDPAQRKKMELAADKFAAVCLARLRSSRTEALSALQNLKVKTNVEKPAYYPDISAREEAVSIEFDKEDKSIKEKDKGKQGGDQVFVALNDGSYNQWNIIPRNGASAVLTDEKVVVSYQIPPQFLGQRVIVTLCSTDPTVIVNTVTGAGNIMVQAAGKRTVEWNYQMDNVPRAIATKPGLLKVYVYGLNNQPKAQINPGVKKASLIIGGAGALVAGAGLYLFLDAKKDHKNIYLPNENLDDPIFTENGADNRDDYYTKINRKNIAGQIMMILGGAAVIGTTTWAVLDKKRNKKALKSAICTAPPRFTLEPMFVSNGAGVRLKF